MWVQCDSACNGCQYRYVPTGAPAANPTGHVVPVRTWRKSDAADSKKLARSTVRKMHKLLFELFYFANNGLPGQSQGGTLASGGVTSASYQIWGISGSVLTVRPDAAVDPRSIPIAPNDVCWFQGGTNFDSRICAIVDDVDFTGCTAPNYEFDVTLSWDCTDLLTGTGQPLYGDCPSTSPSASDSQSMCPPTVLLAICQYTRPAYNSLYAHEMLPVKCKRVILEPTLVTSSGSASVEDSWSDLDAYGAYTLEDHDGNTSNVRISRPISEDEIPIGDSAASDAPGTFRVRTYDGSTWTDVTSGFLNTELDPVSGTIVVRHWWKRLQVTHTAAGNDYVTKLYLRNYIPNANGVGWESVAATDYCSGVEKIEIRYYVHYPNADTAERGRYHQQSMLCSNCKRDYAEWVGGCGGGGNGYGTDADGRHWFCSARATASGVANFVPGRCTQQRSCDSYNFGDPELPTPATLAEIDTAKWISECQIWPGLSNPNNLFYYWSMGPSIYLLGGHYYDTPTQYHGKRAAEANGGLGYWLYGVVQCNDIAAHYGAIYDLSLTCTGLSCRWPGLLVNSGVTHSGTYTQNKRALSGAEDGTSDPNWAHRDSLMRKPISTTLRPLSASQMFFTRARTTSGYEGENRIQRCVPQSTAVNIYFPMIDITETATTDFEHGSVSVGSWSIGGVEYSIKISVDRVRKTHGTKRLGGLACNAYGEETQNRGRAYASSFAGGLLTVDCYPGVHLIAVTGSAVSGPDIVRPYIGSGNVVEHADCHRPRSTYEFYTYNKFGDVLDKAYAGDCVEFSGIGTLSGKKFYIQTANPSGGTSFAEQTTDYSVVNFMLPPLFNGLSYLDAAGGDSIVVNGAYYYHDATNYNGAVFSKTTAGTKTNIDYGDARSGVNADDWYWRDDTKSGLFDDAAFTAAISDYDSTSNQGYCKVRVYYAIDGGAETYADIDLCEELVYTPSVSVSPSASAQGLLLQCCNIPLTYAPDTADQTGNCIEQIDIFTGERTELSYGGQVALDEWPANTEYAYANNGDDWYMMFHPDLSGEVIEGSYKLASSVSSGNPPALPGGVTGFATSVELRPADNRR